MSAILNDCNDSIINVHKTNFKTISSGEYNLIRDNCNIFYLSLENAIVLKLEANESKTISRKLYDKFESLTKTHYKNIIINEKEYDKFDYNVVVFKTEEKIELKLKISENDLYPIIENTIFNPFKPNLVYDIYDFICYDKYAIITSKDKKYSVNKNIRDILTKFKIEDDRIYCTYKGEEIEIKLRIVVGNEKEAIINGQKINYLEQKLEIVINNKISAYYINSCGKINHDNPKDFYAFTNFVIHNKNVYGYEPYKRQYINLNNHKQVICELMNKEIKKYDNDEYGHFIEGNKDIILIFRFKQSDTTGRNYIVYRTQPLKGMENEFISLDQITPCVTAKDDDDEDIILPLTPTDIPSNEKTNNTSNEVENNSEEPKSKKQSKRKSNKK